MSRSVWEYFTTEQQEKMTKQMERFTSEQLKGLRKESTDLIDRLRKEMEKSTPAENPEVLRLAKRLKELSDSFAEPDPEIDNAVERFHVENPDKQQHGMDLKLYRYIELAKSCIQ